MAQALGKTAAKRRTGRRSPRAAVAGRKETTRNVTPSRRTTDRPDLYIGLVCAAGTDLTDVKNQLRAQLSVVGYRYEEIKVSTTIAELLEIKAPDDEYERILRLMRAGDLLRSNSDDGEGVAAAIVAEIRRRRDGDTLPRSTAYVIDSLKNPAEIKLLDQIYGRNYYTVSIYLPKEDRRTSLKNKIAQGRHQPPGAAHESLADELISEDERGIGARSQNVQDSFPKADFFVNATEDVAGQVKRFVELIFREPFTTPTPDEFHMFVAKAAALRSCDLSRQVGAVIVDPCKSIISTGCNEVPYPDGGIFYEGRLGGIGDNRDYTKGHDPNYIEIQRTLIEFIGLLQESGHIQSKDEPSAIADGLLHGQYRELMSNARIRNLIEFGRVVHAEMNALAEAAGAGRSVKAATLYCTTFPCHGCARHVIASGIHEVIFIEPYPKSLTQQLYDGEIEMVHGQNAEADERRPIAKVRFRSFQGVAPALYQRVFAFRDRKDQTGTIAVWAPRKATPIGAVFGVERPNVETAASDSIATILENINDTQAREEQGIRDGSAVDSRTN
jgi:deoxycytidylate deaminase